MRPQIHFHTPSPQWSGTRTVNAFDPPEPPPVEVEAIVLIPQPDQSGWVASRVRLVATDVAPITYEPNVVEVQSFTTDVIREVSSVAVKLPILDRRGDVHYVEGVGHPHPIGYTFAQGPTEALAFLLDEPETT